MNNGKHVVNHLFFRRKFDLVDDNELAVMLVTNVTNEFEAEAHQSILMGNDQTANFTTANSVYKSQKLRSLEILSPPISVIHSSTTVPLPTAHICMDSSWRSKSGF